MQKESTVTIKISPSFECEDDNFFFKVKNAGNQYETEDEQIKFSDLYLKIRILEDEYFRKEGNNIYTENFVSLSQFILGGSMQIFTLEGVKEIRLNPGQESYVLENHGINSKGHHYIKINIRLPKELNSQQSNILEELKKLKL